MHRYIIPGIDHVQIYHIDQLQVGHLQIYHLDHPDHAQIEHISSADESSRSSRSCTDIYNLHIIYCIYCTDMSYISCTDRSCTDRPSRSIRPQPAIMTCCAGSVLYKIQHRKYGSHPSTWAILQGAIVVIRTHHPHQKLYIPVFHQACKVLITISPRDIPGSNQGPSYTQKPTALGINIIAALVSIGVSKRSLYFRSEWCVSQQFY